LFKGGDCSDPNNFRGISIASCLGKIFNRTMNKRLQNKIETDKKLRDSQAAYRTDHSTVDQIFIFKALLNKYTKINNKALFACFVDFKKAFDSIWHSGLLFKLLDQYNIDGKFYSIIKSMYKNANSCVKLSSGITESFRLEKGIKQGDTLSPYLFNLYLNDIHDLFNDKSGTPPKLAEQLVGGLLYADDLLIISETPQRLQKSLDRLHKYCEKWRLQVNFKKTKIVIFKKRESKTNLHI
jgi:hypothetical protein